MRDTLLYMPYIWLGAAVLLGIAEAMTDQLVAIWFAIGAVCAMLISYTMVPVPVQVIVFIIVSAIVLYFVRPMAEKAMRHRTVRTNVSSLIGMIGVVTIDINNAHGRGRVNVNNSDWAAYSEDGSEIFAGEEVVVKAISGVKVIVETVI